VSKIDVFILLYKGIGSVNQLEDGEILEAITNASFRKPRLCICEKVL
jgi:hypothetical protein